MAGDIVTLKDVETKASITGAGGRTPQGITGAKSSVWFNEALDGEPRHEDLFAVRLLGRTGYIEMAKDIIKDQVASTDFTVKPVIPEDEDREPTDQERRAAAAMTEFFHGNFNTDNESFDHLLKAVLNDTLDFNSAPVELVPDNDGYLKELIIRDGLTFTKNVLDNGKLPSPNSGEPAYYQFSLSAQAEHMFQSERQGIDLRSITDELNRIGFNRVFSRETRPFGRSQIAWFEMDARSENPYGRGKTQKVKKQAEHLINGDLHRNRFFLDNEYHKGFLSVPDTISQQDKDKIQERFQDSAGNEHEMIVLGAEDANYISIDPNPEEMQFLESHKWFNKLALSIYGLNANEAGFVEDSSRNVSEQQQKNVWNRTTQPFLEMIERVFTNQVLPFMREYESVDTEFKFCFEPQNDFLRKIQNEFINQEQSLGTMTLNEARREKGKESYGPLGDLPKTVVENLASSHPGWVAEQMNPEIEDTPSDDGGGGLFGSFLDLDNNNNNNNDDSGKEDSKKKSTSVETKESFSDYPQEAVDNARQALEARENEEYDNSDCGTRVGWEQANQLDNGEALSEETIKRMHSFFERHDGNQTVDEPPKEEDCGWLTWMAWGGQAGFDWVTEKLEEIEDSEEDSKEREGKGNGKPLHEISSYREAFKQRDKLLDHTKDALRNERGFEDVPGIVEHKDELKEDVAEVFENSINLDGELEKAFPENDQESGVLVNADEIVEELDFRGRLASVLETNNLGALEMSAEHFEKDIEEKTEERLTVPSETKIELSFDVLDTFTADIIREQALENATIIESSIKDRLKNQILKGASEGEGIPSIKSRITDTVSDISDSNAELVARTETLQSSRKGSQALAESTDLISGKEWLATSDSRVREWHSVMDGQIVPKDDHFVVPKTGSDKQPSNYPRNARVVGEDQPFNCRCSQAPVLAEDMPDSVQQLDAEFSSVSVDLGVSKRQFEVWKEHGQEYDSFEGFWKALIKEHNGNKKQIVDKDIVGSRKTIYNWNDQFGIQ